MWRLGFDTTHNEELVGNGITYYALTDNVTATTGQAFQLSLTQDGDPLTGETLEQAVQNLNLLYIISNRDTVTYTSAF